MYCYILVDKNISFLPSSYKKLNHFFKILFELALVSPTVCSRPSNSVVSKQRCQRGAPRAGKVTGKHQHRRPSTYERASFYDFLLHYEISNEHIRHVHHIIGLLPTCMALFK